MNTCAETDSPVSWVALIVRPRGERSVQEGLTKVGLETFVPWHGVRRRWSDRVKILKQSLFPGYVFCRSSFAERRLVINQAGVRGVVSFDGRPALIPNTEISSLWRAVESQLPLGPWPFLSIGQRVRIEKSLLAGLEGTLAGDSTAWPVVLNIKALEKSVAIEVDRDMIVPENPSGGTAWPSTSLETKPSYFA